jgi:hypothetical protein
VEQITTGEAVSVRVVRASSWTNLYLLVTFIILLIVVYIVLTRRGVFGLDESAEGSDIGVVV